MEFEPPPSPSPFFDPTPPTSPQPMEASGDRDIERNVFGGSVGAIIAWLVIVVVVIGMAVAVKSASNAPAPNPGEDNAIEAVMIGIQGRYAVGALRAIEEEAAKAEAEAAEAKAKAAEAKAAEAEEAGPRTEAAVEAAANAAEAAKAAADAGPMLYESLAALDAGSAGQRMRFAILAGELKGAATAREHLDQLSVDIEQRQAAEAEKAKDEMAEDEKDEKYALSPALRDAVDMLDRLYPSTEACALVEDENEIAMADPSVLSTDEQTALVETLGWFGHLALASGADGPEASNEVVEAGASRTLVVILGAAGGGFVLAVGGFLGLIVVFVLVISEKLPLWFRRGGTGHGVYAETFAVWLVGFTLILKMLEQLPIPVAYQMPVTGFAFFLSLVALFWPMLRGVPFHQVRVDIGWVGGRGVVREVLCGFAGYAMALPILAVGLGITLVLILMQSGAAGPPPLLDPATGPAHPIIGELGRGGFIAVLPILFLASIAAPVVEETMFRGVLYRHLRDYSRNTWRIFSIIFSVFLNTLVFALIHPQGLVAVPALMGLATAFTLAREWRESLIAPMVMHGISNGLVLSFVALLAQSG